MAGDDEWRDTYSPETERGVYGETRVANRPASHPRRALLMAVVIFAGAVVAHTRTQTATVTPPGNGVPNAAAAVPGQGWLTGPLFDPSPATTPTDPPPPTAAPACPYADGDLRRGNDPMPPAAAAVAA